MVSPRWIGSLDFNGRELEYRGHVTLKAMHPHSPFGDGSAYSTCPALGFIIWMCPISSGNLVRGWLGCNLVMSSCSADWLAQWLYLSYKMLSSRISRAQCATESCSVVLDVWEKWCSSSMPLCRHLGSFKYTVHAQHRHEPAHLWSFTTSASMRSVLLCWVPEGSMSPSSIFVQNFGESHL